MASITVYASRVSPSGGERVARFPEGTELTIHRWVDAEAWCRSRQIRGRRLRPGPPKSIGAAIMAEDGATFEGLDEEGRYAIVGKVPRPVQDTQTRLTESWRYVIASTNRRSDARNSWR